MEPSSNVEATQLPPEDKPEAVDQPVPPKPEKPKQTFKCLVCSKSWVLSRFCASIWFDLVFLTSFFAGSFVLLFRIHFLLSLSTLSFCLPPDIARKRHCLHIIRRIRSIACTAGRTEDRQSRIFTSTTWSTSTLDRLSASFVVTHFSETSSL